MTKCWLWKWAKNGDGYPVVRINGRLALAHRVAYRINVGPIPRGKEIDHKCNRRSCVNPAHLKPVTHLQNIRLARARARRAA